MKAVTPHDGSHRSALQAYFWSWESLCTKRNESTECSHTLAETEEVMESQGRVLPQTVLPRSGIVSGLMTLSALKSAKESKLSVPLPAPTNCGASVLKIRDCDS